MNSLAKKILTRIGTGFLMLLSFTIGSILTRIPVGNINLPGVGAGVVTLGSVILAVFSGLLVADPPQRPIERIVQVENSPTPTPGETIPPSTPLPSLTPSKTLLPPPTFEPPTQTPMPSNTPTLTPTTDLQVNVVIPGIHGLETPTPSTTPGCEIREEWKLIYTVQANDALATIAQKYGTYVSELVEANCLTDANMIVVGQRLHVPGEVHPAVPAVECVPFEVLTPINSAYNLDGAGNLTFNWRGPRAPRNLIRVFKPDGTQWERTVDLRQNETIDLATELPLGGTYTWYVYPLDMNFVQIAGCKEGGPWVFSKTAAPPTPTPFPLDGTGQ